MSDLITTDLVRLDVNSARQVRRDPRPGRDRRRRGTRHHVEELVEDVRPRGHVAHRPARRHRDPPLPHDRCPSPRRSSPGSARVDFGAKDGPADLAFLIAAPAGGDSTHLQLLTKLARALVKPAFTASLREAESPRKRSSWSPRWSAPQPQRPPLPRRAPAAGSAQVASAGASRPRGTSSAGAPPRRRPCRPRRAPAAWSPSPRARPASPTRTWRPRPRGRRRAGRGRSRWRPRDRRARTRSPRTPSPGRPR